MEQTGKRIRDLQQNNPVFYRSLMQRLSALILSPTDSPTDYARLGYIARWCGNLPVSEDYLRKAVEDLPYTKIEPTKTSVRIG